MLPGKVATIQNRELKLKMNKKVVIIGAGLGGLATAIRLSSLGWEVTVVEQGSRPGGKLNRFSHLGYTFDTGPSLITLPHVFDRLFNVCGSDFYKLIKPLQIDPLFEYRFDAGDRLTYSSDLPELAREIERVTGSIDDVKGLYRFLKMGAKLFELSEKTFFQSTPMSRPTFEDLKSLLSAPKLHAWGSYDKAVRRHFKSSQMRQIFQRYPTYVGASPHRSMGTLALIPYMELAFGGWYVPGGLYRIVEELVLMATRAGVQMEMSTRVSQIQMEGKRVTGVVSTSGQFYDADVVVSNADPASVFDFTDGVAGTKLKAEEHSMSGFVMLLGLDRKVEGLRHHTVCFSGDYDREFKQIIDEQRFPDDPTVYVNIPTVTDDSMAPSGKESVFLMANAPAGSQVWTREFELEAAQRIRKRLVLSGMPDFMEHARFVEYWNPARFEREYSSPRGSIYGRVAHGWGGTFLRPPLKDPQVQDLFYVGGGTHPGGGTPTVLLSAEIVSGMVGKP